MSKGLFFGNPPRQRRAEIPASLKCEPFRWQAQPQRFPCDGTVRSATHLPNQAAGSAGSSRCFGIIAAVALVAVVVLARTAPIGGTALAALDTGLSAAAAALSGLAVAGAAGAVAVVAVAVAVAAAAAALAAALAAAVGVIAAVATAVAADAALPTFAWHPATE